MLNWSMVGSLPLANARYVPDTNWNPVWEDELDGGGTPVQEPPEGADLGNDDVDSLPNWLEDYYGTDRYDPDSDNDGATDSDEVLVMGTDPTNPDTDGNGVNDHDQWLASQPPLITTPDSISFDAGVAVAYRLTACAGAGGYQWSLDTGSAPSADLSLWVDGATGYAYIVGWPAIGSYEVTVGVSAANGLSSSKTITVVVNYPPPEPPKITTASPLPTAVLGTPYIVQFAAQDGSTPYSFAFYDGSLPGGLAFTADACVTGVPTEAGTWSFTVQVTGGDGYQSQSTFSLEVQDPTEPLQVATGEIQIAGIGQPYTLNLNASGGTQPYSWGLDSGLPAGLVMDGALISGTPTSTGSWQFTVTVTDSAVNSANGVITLTVTEDPPPPVDSDGDGLTDQLEAELAAQTGLPMSDSSETSNGLGSNDWFVWYIYRAMAEDSANDTDGDGLGPVLEAHLGTLEWQYDSNGDGRPDWYVWWQQVLSYTDHTDSDMDGLTAQLEQMIGSSDLSQDSDGDGLSDAYEWAHLDYSDPTKLDTDGDGLSDGAEYNAGTSARNVDTDGDQLTDFEEVVAYASYYSFNPLSQFSGTDGVPDYYRAWTLGLLVDSDGAGIPDRLEIWWGLNPSNPADEQGDADSDGITNLTEYNSGYDIYGTFNQNYDSDGDGMTNVWEIANGTNPDVPDAGTDPDHDWWLNLEEFQRNTNPHSDPANPDIPPPEDVSGFNHASNDWDGDGVDNLTEVLLERNPRLAEAPPPCICTNTSCPLTNCSCAGTGSCGTTSCSCTNTSCPLSGCTCGGSGSCTTTTCSCGDDGCPISNCSCGGTGGCSTTCGCDNTECAGDNCADPNRGGTNCKCGQQQECTCDQSTCDHLSPCSCASADLCGPLSCGSFACNCGSSCPGPLSCSYQFTCDCGGGEACFCLITTGCRNPNDFQRPCGVAQMCVTAPTCQGCSNQNDNTCPGIGCGCFGLGTCKKFVWEMIEVRRPMIGVEVVDHCFVLVRTSPSNDGNYDYWQVDTHGGPWTVVSCTSLYGDEMQAGQVPGFAVTQRTSLSGPDEQIAVAGLTAHFSTWTYSANRTCYNTFSGCLIYFQGTH